VCSSLAYDIAANSIYAANLMPKAAPNSCFCLASKPLINSANTGTATVDAGAVAAR
jgi:hypothetical protein